MDLTSLCVCTELWSLKAETFGIQNERIDQRLSQMIRQAGQTSLHIVFFQQMSV